LTTSVSGVVAPISSPPFTSLMPRSSATWLKSTTTLGRLVRSFSQSNVSSPPAITQADDPWRSSNPSASLIVAGWNNSNAGIMSRITAISAP
jgi:hypothetical protein